MKNTKQFIAFFLTALITLGGFSPTLSAQEMKPEVSEESSTENFGDAPQVAPANNNFVNAQVIAGLNGFRVTLQAECERACRGRQTIINRREKSCES